MASLMATMFSICGQTFDGIDRQAGAAAAAGDVVQHQRDVDFFGDGLEVLIEPFLRGLVVVGADLQRGVSADFAGMGGQFDGLGGAVGAGAGDDGDLAVHDADDALDDLLCALRS